jgi:hypothetical protein
MMFPRPEKPERGTAEAKRYMGKVAQLSCVICARHPVQLHHPIMGRFAQRRSSDLDVIPLCQKHHDDLHNRPALWADRFGQDCEYSTVVRMQVAELDRRTI